MKLLTVLLLLAAPAAAQPMGMHGGMHGGGFEMGTHMAVVLYALLAALGYWVLQHSAKETAKYVKRAGQILGWAFIVVGLLGILCGLASHARMAMERNNCRCPGAEMMEQGEPGDMPMMHNMQMMHPGQPMPEEMIKKPEASPKKK
ncbi:MAG: hypothetical protein NTX59_06130 [Elusimicrobia bacterium]|nr:hypothetical protein [Elusimicrobiota bacterium]